MLVGSDMYGFSAAAAALVEPPAALLAPAAAGADELAALKELFEPDEPHAASARQSTSVPIIAVN
jgi:hypothetical protein